MCFLRKLHQNPQVNPQEKRENQGMAGLATKVVEVEPGLVPRLVGGWLRP